MLDIHISLSSDGPVYVTGVQRQTDIGSIDYHHVSGYAFIVRIGTIGDQ